MGGIVQNIIQFICFSRFNIPDFLANSDQGMTETINFGIKVLATGKDTVGA